MYHKPHYNSRNKALIKSTVTKFERNNNLWFNTKDITQDEVLIVELNKHKRWENIEELLIIR